MTFKIGAKQTVGEAPKKDLPPVPGSAPAGATNASEKAKAAPVGPLPSEASELAAGRPIIINARSAFTVHAGESLVWNGRELLFMGKQVGVRDGLDAPVRTVTFTEEETKIIPRLLAFIAQKEQEHTASRPDVKPGSTQYGFSGCAWEDAYQWLQEGGYKEAAAEFVIDRLLEGNWLREPVLGRLRLGEPWSQ